MTPPPLEREGGPRPPPPLSDLLTHGQPEAAAHRRPRLRPAPTQPEEKAMTTPMSTRIASTLLNLALTPLVAALDTYARWVDNALDEGDDE